MNLRILGRKLSYQNSTGATRDFRLIHRWNFNLIQSLILVSDLGFHIITNRTNDRSIDEKLHKLRQQLNGMAMHLRLPS